MRSLLSRRQLALLAAVAFLFAPSLPAQGGEARADAPRGEARADTARGQARTDDTRGDSVRSREAALELRYTIAERQREIESARDAKAVQSLESRVARWKRGSLLSIALLVAFAGWLLLRQQQAQGARAEELQTTDPLTGLRNRRFVQQMMPAEASGVSRRHRVATPGQAPTDSDLVFFVIDIDHLRRINELHGHAAGDRVLEQVARQLTATLRDSDVVARWGGEEFLVVSRFTNRDRAAELAERIRGKVEAMQTALPTGELVSVTCSIGFAAFPFSRSAPESVGWEGAVALADIACYAAKRDGRNGWARFRASEHDGIDVALQDVSITAIDARVADGSIVLEGSRDGSVAPQA